MADAARMWRVVGIDTFAREEYGLGRFATRAEAMAAARDALTRIAMHQAGAGELQDSVAVIDADGVQVPIDPA
ncbi:hypothetical protein J2Y54_001867 [Sphingomonas sp. BE123]|uniref:hypothetical protein n=1 Tax=Sphingomonas sp. BE123 TaxID=2817842 RepID=UPI002860BEB8|nr:hypothetical protein [Sphingomonas sp. BE123]MDR6852347.1 hypothetical protein [Sphingomonas sp. BE123]